MRILPTKIAFLHPSSKLIPHSVPPEVLIIPHFLTLGATAVVDRRRRRHTTSRCRRPPLSRSPSMSLKGLLVPVDGARSRSLARSYASTFIRKIGVHIEMDLSSRVYEENEETLRNSVPYPVSTLDSRLDSDCEEESATKTCPPSIHGGGHFIQFLRREGEREGGTLEAEEEEEGGFHPSETSFSLLIFQVQGRGTARKSPSRFPSSSSVYRFRAFLPSALRLRGNLATFTSRVLQNATNESLLLGKHKRYRD